MSDWAFIAVLLAFGAAVVLFRLPVGRIIAVLVLIGAGYWAYTMSGGDLPSFVQAAWDQAYSGATRIKSIIEGTNGIATQVDAIFGK